jgi:hypothetical protein
MGMSGRLARLEARLGGPGCACERSPATIRFEHDPPAGPCPDCGRVAEPRHFTIEFERMGKGQADGEG